jgi:hypothetical protein
MLNARKVKRIARMVERRLKKQYRGGTYFYIDSLTLGLEDMAGLADVHCVCGYEKYEAGAATGEYHQVDFTFDHVGGFVKSNRECAAVLTLHCIEALDETCYFQEGRK